ncbi:HelD family protein [Chengkuizengella axinellae]|uniref:DNA 3'-5' helicase n=1 Tax=Chengkuizengella axinellae TaxID=3064388 RepID=A0ABT9J2I4_9BACL|nr:3'-5' exonuclease [Chengkuizengella sp. 2205SS18-9]MDP5275219.1 3'-5' exonuclease [Chengkuizengella sp. 2205SS18-9]
MRLEKLDHLNGSLSAPYFGRIDFEEQFPNIESLQNIYIGKFGIEDIDSREIIVVDWRSPIASLFYSFNGGEEPVSYESPDGFVEGNIHLKRNIVIRNQTLDRVVDSYVRGQEHFEGVSDEFLIYRLQENKDDKLKDIVSTIQEEQDKIIRSPKNMALIIQGVAGSGKTTVALHRLAYLLYHYRDQIKAENLIIFAPNKMFLDYISNVLPELGIGRVQQYTFYEWALEIIDFPSKIKVHSIQGQYEKWFKIGDDQLAITDVSTERYKGSLQFQQIILQCLSTYEEHCIPDMDLELWEGKILSRETIHKWFYEEYQIFPLMIRRDHVTKRITRFKNSELKYIDKGIQKKLKSQANKVIRSYFKKWTAFTAVDFYSEIFSKPSSVLSNITLLIPEIIKQETKKSLKNKELHFEDLAALLYIHNYLYGIKSDFKYDHIVIDEAQDYSPFQVIVLKEHVRNHSFSILGDLAQGIHSYHGINDWKEIRQLFSEEETSYFQLQVSYRSTAEIIQFSNKIISFSEQSLLLATPVVRSGQEVSINHTPKEKLPNKIKNIVEKEKNVHSIAIVGRTDEECTKLHRLLSEEGLQCHLITSNLENYDGGISIVPAFLAKGLEFDVVIIVDVDEEHYPKNELNIKLLYVACTRALHKLYLLYSNNPSPLIS